jgi:hypothetical protein
VGRRPALDLPSYESFTAGFGPPEPASPGFFAKAGQALGRAREVIRRAPAIAGYYYAGQMPGQEGFAGRALTAPEEEFEPSQIRELISPPEQPATSIPGAIARGVAGEVGTILADPEQLAILAGLRGLGGAATRARAAVTAAPTVEAAAAAASRARALAALQRGVSAGFAAEMLPGAAEGVAEAGRRYMEGGLTPETAEAATQAALGTLFTLGAGLHAVGPTPAAARVPSPAEVQGLFAHERPIGPEFSYGEAPIGPVPESPVPIGPMGPYPEPIGPIGEAPRPLGPEPLPAPRPDRDFITDYRPERIFRAPEQPFLLPDVEPYPITPSWRTGLVTEAAPPPPAPGLEAQFGQALRAPRQVGREATFELLQGPPIPEPPPAPSMAPPPLAAPPSQVPLLPDLRPVPTRALEPPPAPRGPAPAAGPVAGQHRLPYDQIETMVDESVPAAEAALRRPGGEQGGIARDATGAVVNMLAPGMHPAKVEFGLEGLKEGPKKIADALHRDKDNPLYLRAREAMRTSIEDRVDLEARYRGEAYEAPGAVDTSFNPEEFEPAAQAATTAPAPRVPYDFPLERVPEVQQVAAREAARGLAREFAETGKLDDAALDARLPENLKAHREAIKSHVVQEASALIQGRDFVEALRERHGEAGPDGVSVVAPGAARSGLPEWVHGMPDSYDIVQRAGGKIVGGAEVRGNTLVMISGGRALDSPVSIRPVYEALDKAGVRRNDILTVLGAEARATRRAAPREEVDVSRKPRPEPPAAAAPELPRPAEGPRPGPEPPPAAAAGVPAEGRGAGEEPRAVAQPTPTAPAPEVERPVVKEVAPRPPEAAKPEAAAPPPAPPSEVPPEAEPPAVVSFGKPATYQGRKRIEVKPPFESPKRFAIEQDAKGAKTYSVVSEETSGATGEKSRTVHASGLTLNEAKRRAPEFVGEAPEVVPGWTRSDVLTALELADEAKLADETGLAPAAVRRALDDLRRGSMTTDAETVQGAITRGVEAERAATSAEIDRIAEGRPPSEAFAWLDQQADPALDHLKKLAETTRKAGLGRGQAGMGLDPTLVGDALQDIVRGLGRRLKELRPSAALVDRFEALKEEAFGKATGKPGEATAALDPARIIREAQERADIRKLEGEARDRAIADDIGRQIVEATLHEAAHGPEGGHGPRFDQRVEDLRSALGGRDFEAAVKNAREKLLQRARVSRAGGSPPENAPTFDLAVWAWRTGLWNEILGLRRQGMAKSEVTETLASKVPWRDKGRITDLVPLVDIWAAPKDEWVAAYDVKYGKGSPGVIASMGADPTVMRDLSLVGARWIRDGVRDVASFTGRLVAEFGQGVTRIARTVWDSAMALLRRGRAEEAATPPPTQAPAQAQALGGATRPTGAEVVPPVLGGPSQPRPARGTKPAPAYTPRPAGSAVPIPPEVEARKAAEAAMKTTPPPAEGKPSAEPAKGEVEADINVERISPEERVQQIVGRIVGAAPGYFGRGEAGARGPVRPWAEVRVEAVKQGFTDSEIKRAFKNKGGMLSDVELEGAKIAADEITKKAANLFEEAERLRKEGKTGAAEDNDVLYGAEVARLMALQYAMIGAKSEAARTLALARKLGEGLDPMERAFQKWLKSNRLLDPKVQREFYKAFKKKDAKTLNDLRRRYADATWMQKIVEGWKAGILSAIPTQVVNFASNAGKITVMEPVEAEIMGMLDFLRSKPEAERNAFNGEGLAMWKGARHALYYALHGREEKGYAGLFPGMKEIFTLKYEESQGRRLLERGAEGASEFEKIGGAIAGKKGEAARIPFHLLNLADAFWKEIAGSQELYRQAYRDGRRQGYAGPRLESHIRDYTAKYADGTLPNIDEIQARVSTARVRNTWQQQLGPVGRSVQQFERAHPFFSFIMPFVKTPFNIGLDILRHTPFGIVEAVWRQAQPEWFRKNFGKKVPLPAELFEKRLAEGIFGTSVAAAIYFTAKDGGLDFTGGGPADPKKRQNLIDTGWQPYSIKWGNRYISYQRLEPLSSIIGMAADARELKDVRTANDAVMKMGSLIGENLTNKTFLAGLEGFTSALHDPVQYGKGFVKQLEGSVVPAIVGRAAQAADATVRETEPFRTTYGVPEPIAARIPGLSRTLPAKRTPTGEERVRHTSAAERFLSPFPITQEEEGPSADLQREFAKLDFIPDQPRKSVSLPGGAKIDLTEKEYEILRASNLEASWWAARLIRSRYYEALDPDDQVEALRKIYSDARRITRSKLYRDREFRQRAAKVARAYREEIAQLRRREV